MRGSNSSSVRFPLAWRAHCPATRKTEIESYVSYNRYCDGHISCPFIHHNSTPVQKTRSFPNHIYRLSPSQFIKVYADSSFSISPTANFWVMILCPLLQWKTPVHSDSLLHNFMASSSSVSHFIQLHFNQKLIRFWFLLDFSSLTGGMTR